METKIFRLNKKAHYPDVLLNQMKEIDWKAGPHLVKRLEDGDLDSRDEIIVITNQQLTLIGFGALLERDILDKEIYPFSPFLSTIYVDPSHRGQGYSTKIVKALEEIAKEKKNSIIYVVTEHIGLYEKSGYQYQNQVRDQFGRDMRLLKKSLAS
ncbi:GNAT family N-acetyltransferase [Streptococcus pseudoporcinus]|uniref:2-keto-3-deoxygluconate permease n=1 Tax=Streptococcus pseudoporcinus TaxID=361101 RepID=A0A4V6Z3N1_9STRE|nr:GNAT family N-acetyltransferase [Streptococcus pseudoporcinus]VTS12407.1 2-keto-3-deoxygluconate permease [Streptococcus pseudoporcinus]VUC64934.1 2-keto-3-deoxygluconate permease [Streptococcus pseudoporcinus]VUC95502.1 2-keto-3-deoxygluconate permease [Streptococcus pseudoporcinus]VUC95897.1 2-keto-3-deoxygluconate permease [Streptococcus pseudoporcinus]